MSTDTRPRLGRPATPKDVAETQLLHRIAELAGHILRIVREPGRGVWDSERQIRGWLVEAEIGFSQGDVAPALALLESLNKIGRHAAKNNRPRTGWVITSNGNGSNPVEEASEGPPEPSGAVQGGGASEAPGASRSAVHTKLAKAIVRAFSVPGRGHEGTRFMCSDENVLRQWLHADDVTWDEPDLVAALSQLEMAQVPGCDFRLLRGHDLHRRQSWNRFWFLARQFSIALLPRSVAP